MIDTFFQILKKSMVAMMFVVVGFAMTYIPQPQHDGGYANVEVAHAGGVFLDPVNLIQNTYTAVQTAATWVVQNWIYLKEFGLDALAWILAKDMLADMTTDVVDWVNSDDEGRQKFIINMKDELLEAADIAVGAFINELDSLDFLCDPWRFDVKLAVAIQWDADREKRPEVECTLFGDIFDNIDDFNDFTEGNFSSGGWGAWFQVVQNPESNTLAGSKAVAQRLAQQEAAEAEKRVENDAIANNSFKSTKVCIDVPGPAGDVEDCYVTTPANVIHDQLNNALSSGAEQLLQVDELDESIGSLLVNFATDAFSRDGLLGLSDTDFGYSGYDRDTTFADDVGPDGADIIDETGDGGLTGDAPDTDLGNTGNPSLDLMGDAIAEAQAIFGELDQYIIDFDDYLNNPNNNDVNNEVGDPEGTNVHPDYPGNIVTAEIYLDQAIDIRVRTDEDLNDLNQAIDLYNLYVETNDEYILTGDPALSSELSDIIQDFFGIGLITWTEFDIYTNNWDALLETDIPYDPGPGDPPGPGPGPDCGAEPFGPGCPCDVAYVPSCGDIP